MKYRYTVMVIRQNGSVHVEDGIHMAEFPNIAGYAKALHAPPSNQPITAVLNALGAVGWHLTAVDREPDAQLYFFSLPY